MLGKITYADRPSGSIIICRPSVLFINVIAEQQHKGTLSTCINRLRYTLEVFTAVFFAHPIAQVFRSLKTQGLRIRIPPEA